MAHKTLFGQAHEHRALWTGLKLLALLFLASEVAAKGSGSRVPPLTFAELKQLALTVGFPASGADVAAAIALAESAGIVAARGDSGSSFGLWQVHAPAWPQFDALQLLDATYNAKAALVISKGGTDFSPWSTFKSGAYLQFMPPQGSV